MSRYAVESYPKPRPISLPLMFQSWCELTFLHWRYPRETVQRLVPRPLEVESFDGSAWVAVAPIASRDLEIFLTARFRLYSLILGKLAYADVDHPPWPLESAEVISVDQTLTQAAGLPRPEGPPLVHYSPGVHVRVARPKLVCR